MTTFKKFLIVNESHRFYDWRVRACWITIFKTVLGNSLLEQSLKIVLDVL